MHRRLSVTSDIRSCTDSVRMAERLRSETLTMGDALAELLADITEAARTIGTLLQQVGNGRPPR